MKIKCLCKTLNGYKFENANTLEDFKKSSISNLKTAGKKYVEIPITFDIETSTIKKFDEYESFMYHSQFCVEGNVYFLRTWKEVISFFRKLKEYYNLSEDRKLVVYIHNLSYEFHFIYRFLKLKNIFAIDTHEVIKCDCEIDGEECIEFRCSYKLTNMNLQKLLLNTPNVEHIKGVGDLDYEKIRTPNTKLTEFENGYCFNDVKGLYEAIIEKLKEFDISKIPLTSTGYIRRMARNEMRKNKKNRKNFLKTELSLEEYKLFKECFRGGNTASNRYLTSKILENVGSYDISSSYPFVMLSEKFPIGKITFATIEGFKELMEYNKKYCTIGTYTLTNVRAKKNCYIPYIPISKCNVCYGDKTTKLIYNGRILHAEEIEITLTNIDFDIILSQYEFDELYVKDFYFSRKDYLPIEIRDLVLQLFYNKSTLKGVKNQEYMYAKNKALLNSTYGMMVTDILRFVIEFDENCEFKKYKNENEEEELEKFYSNRNNFLSYQWGVFITSYARRNLQRGLDLIGCDVIYCDTDSIKYINNHDLDFIKLNNEIIKRCEKENIKHYVDVKGKRIYLGLWDKEKTYKEFVTLGAKKYAYKYDVIKIKETSNSKYCERGVQYGVTVAGLSKEKGAKEISKKGLKDFTVGKIFMDSGRTTAKYNNDKIHYINVNGEKILTASNIAIVPTTYTLGITNEMNSILKMIGVI